MNLIQANDGNEKEQLNPSKLIVGWFGRDPTFQVSPDARNVVFKDMTLVSEKSFAISTHVRVFFS